MKGVACMIGRDGADMCDILLRHSLGNRGHSRLTARVEMMTARLPSVSAMMCRKMARMLGSDPLAQLPQC
jgi:hypothetical protein